ncbi:MAG: HD domain-containing protein [Puniceicoccales bacterium]|jgi:tRNA nucleotidyltransferase (CCA-adding enzyme)|nr:HD domain-containing protein [Puniceicoccales bacterium]
MANVDLTNQTFLKLSKVKVGEVALDICKELACVSAKPYFVGGCVRDAILGKRLADFDIEVFGISLVDIERILAPKFAIEKTGKAFCVLKIHDFPIDVSIPRTEIKTGNKHTDFSVNSLEKCSVKTAASRRDFTINAIYFDVMNEKTIDEFGGLKDLRFGILRHVGEKFSDDPLRVLRGMQFAGRFNLKAAEETICLCRNLSPFGLSKERIFLEWEKLMLQSEMPSLGLRFLKNVDWLKFFPQIEALDKCPQSADQHAEGSVFEHTCLALDVFAKNKIGDRTEDLILGFATLCHDFGKPYVVTQSENGIHHHGHDEIGVQYAESFLKLINAPNYLIKAVLPLVKWHMIPRFLYRDNRTDSAVLHLANNMGRIDRLARLCYIDYMGRICDDKYDGKLTNWLTETAKKFGILTKQPMPIIQGRDLIQCGLSPSNHFSKILDQCFVAQLNCEFCDHTSGIAYLKKVIQNSDIL